MSNVYIIVDDELVNLIILDMMINRIDKNAIVFKCGDGEVGLKTFKQCIDNGYDIKAVVCDLQMPGMDGEETTKKMCAVYKEKSGKFINESPCKFTIFTANESYDSVSNCGECGCNCVIDVEHKPVTKEKAKEMINFVEKDVSSSVRLM